MKAFVYSAKQNKKGTVQIMGGDDQHILSTIPLSNAQFLFFTPDQPVLITCLIEENLFSFETTFVRILTMHDRAYFQYRILSFTMEQEKRKEERFLVNLPCVLSSSREFLLGTVLDMSANGCQFASKQPIISKNETLHLSCMYNDKPLIGVGKIVRESYQNTTFFYGLTVKWNYQIKGGDLDDTFY